MKKKNIKATFKNGKNFLELSEHEIDCLHLLYIYRSFTTKQLSKLLSIGGDSNQNTYRRRITLRYVEMGLLNKQMVRKSSIYLNYNFYTLTRAGLHLLERLGKIKNSEVDKYLDSVNLSIKNLKHIEHYFGTRNVLVSVINRNLSRFKELTYINKRYIVTKSNNTRQYLYADAVVGNKEKRLYIEYDNATEKLPQIKEKIVAYGLLAKQEPLYKHVVALVVSDDDDRSQETRSRYKRIYGMKHIISELSEIHMGNLEIYVLPEGRAHEVLGELLAGNNSHLENGADWEVTLIPNFFSPSNKKNLFTDSSQAPFHIVKMESISLPSVEKSYNMGIATTKEQERVLFIMLEEGNVRTWATLNHFLKHRKEYIGEGRVIVYYQLQEELENDILGIKETNVFFGSIDAFRNAELYSSVFLKQKNSYIMNKAARFDITDYEYEEEFDPYC